MTPHLGLLLFVACAAIVALFTGDQRWLAYVFGALLGCPFATVEARRQSLRERFIAFDDALAAHGVPPLTAWWREGIGRWLDAYEAGRVLELWACVGRGAAKSTAIYKLALFFTLFVELNVPTGERHFAVVLSRLKEEAGKGVAIISRWLALLGVKHHVAGDVVELDDMARGIRVVAASVGAASGWRAYFIGCDEFSKWAMGGAETFDAAEVRSSAIAMTATHRDAPIVTAGSAWGAFGEFYDAITGGTTDSRVVLGPAPTWIAAPHTTEEDTRRKERDPRRWAREYACEFQAGAASAFDTEAIDAAFAARALPPTVVAGAPLMVIDASSGRADAWTWARCRWLLPPSRQYKMEKRYSHLAGWYFDYVLDARGERIELEPEEYFAPTLQFEAVEGVEGAFWRQGAAVGEQIVERIAADCRKHGATRVVGDQREALMLSAAFARHQIPFTSIPWTAPNKESAVASVRRWLRDRQVILPAHEKLRRELVEFEEKITPSGAITFGARGAKHDDYVALLLTAALADANGLISMSPMQKQVYRYVPDGYVA